MKRLRVMNEKYSYKNCNIIKVKEILEKLYFLMEGNSTLSSKIKKDCFISYISKEKNPYDNEEFFSITIIPYKINESSIEGKKINGVEYQRINNKGFTFYIYFNFSSTLKNVDICTFGTNKSILMHPSRRNVKIIDSKILYYLSILNKVIIKEFDDRLEKYIHAIDKTY